jgi:TRAP-type C4-dicarboxylate transport system permease small subunit
MLTLFDRFLRLLALAAGLALLLLMIFTVLDVFLRYLFNAPFRSVYEFTEYMMALIVFLGIAYCGWTGGHIAVDLFAKWLDRPGLRLLPALLAFVGAALFILIAYQATLETVATLDQVSNLLRWPHYPFRFAVALGSALFAVVLVIQGLDSLRRKPPGESQNAP